MLVTSADTLRHAGIDPKNAPLHQVRGRTERVAVYAFSDPRMLFEEVTA